MIESPLPMGSSGGGLDASNFGSHAHDGSYEISSFFNPQQSSLTYDDMSANSMYMTPFMTSVTKTYTRIGARVSSAAASSTVRFGIYTTSSTTGLPSALLGDYGTIDTSSTGDKEITISETLTAGVLYWICGVSTHATTKFYGVDAVTAGLYGVQSSSQVGSNYYLMGTDSSYNTALPTTAPTDWKNSAQGGGAGRPVI